MRSILCAALFAAITPAHAGQPISKSMADCGGLLLGISAFLDNPSSQDYAISSSAIWADAAAAEAGRDMTEELHATAQDWRDRGMMVAFSQDFRDWTSYCRALAKHRGIKFPPRL
ncbi:MAG: hypothetical protein AAGA08_06015 [Pseudomonadota bacterium]